MADKAFSGVVKRSPVYTGSFRASWRLHKGSVDLSTTEDHLRHPFSPLGPPPRSTIVFNADELAIIYVSNSISYAYDVEVLGTKYSPPGAVIRATVVSIT